MSDDNQNSVPPEPQKPEVRRGLQNLSLIWLVPLVAVIIGGWLLWREVSSKGPEITVTFQSAEGLTQGKTAVRYRDVDVGTVKKIALSDDFSKVVLTLQMNSDVEKYLTDKTKFWVVRPRVSSRGISGLETIVTGAYIEIVPNEDGEATTEFVGSEEPQFVADGSEGTRFVLTADELGSINSGAPILLHGVSVGEVLDTSLDAAAKKVSIPIYIKAPYDKLVTNDSRFWDSSGVSVDLSAQGVSVRAQSIRSVIQGGINFMTPPGNEGASPAKSNTVFTLYKNRKQAESLVQGFTQKFMLYFDGSIRGLSADAPVEFRGIRIGTVDSVNLEYLRDKGMFRAPVQITVEPERIQTVGDKPQSAAEYKEVIDQLIEHGLRARLKTSSFLTGQLYVDMDMYPLAPARYLGDGKGNVQELPTLPNQIDEITDSLQSLLAKVETIPIEQIGIRVLGTVEGMEDLVTSPELKKSMQSIQEASNGINQLVSHLDSSVLPATEEALDEARKTMTDLRDMTAPNSPVRYNLEESLKEISSAARSVRTLTDYLEQNPNALILGKSGNQEE
ncbi:intermembrane transport protein PqiB [Thalassospira marina]|uniref:Qaraquat-inducible protein B n=1 Tax=Thalassospira marina TaxID=2048283 RepID=A0A2N3KVC1_9PROT|nr:MlaD family protein [Thalassospira marina]AUG52774.1 qaraquat-inducible protein B [Thalassospira marina]PKR54450.1 qaraquat-inducible protein B [Thalassospira marina]